MCSILLPGLYNFFRGLPFFLLKSSSRNTHSWPYHAISAKTNKEPIMESLTRSPIRDRHEKSLGTECVLAFLSTREVVCAYGSSFQGYVARPSPLEFKFSWPYMKVTDPGLGNSEWNNVMEWYGGKERRLHVWYNVAEGLRPILDSERQNLLCESRRRKS